jgi:hypothetical protein
MNRYPEFEKKVKKERDVEGEGKKKKKKEKGCEERGRGGNEDNPKN